MSKRLELQLRVGQTHGTKEIFFASRQLECFLAESGLAYTMIQTKGSEGGSYSSEEGSIVELDWPAREGPCELEVFCDGL